MTKNIIPAIASTNALVAAACVQEALKLATFCGQTLNNYFMYMGASGCFTRSFDYKRNESCPVCGSKRIKVALPGSATVQVKLLSNCIHFYAILCTCTVPSI